LPDKGVKIGRTENMQTENVESGNLGVSELMGYRLDERLSIMLQYSTNDRAQKYRLLGMFHAYGALCLLDSETFNNLVDMIHYTDWQGVF